MGIRRVLTGAVLGLAGSVLLALPAWAAPADPYGPAATPGALGTSTTSVAVGGAVTITGNGFASLSTVTIDVTVEPAGFGRFDTDSVPAPLGRLAAAGSMASVQRLAVVAACVDSCTVTATAAGTFSVAVTLTGAGTNLITATGVDPDGVARVLTTAVVVASGTGVGGTGATSGSAGSATGVGLPNTGTDLRTPVLLGGLLVLIGGGAVVLGRRRKGRKVSA